MGMTMKKIFSLALLCMLAASVAHAENFTQKNTDHAKQIIGAAVEAHGGDALLDDLNTLIVEHETVNYSVDQSRGTEPPWDKPIRYGMMTHHHFDHVLGVTAYEEEGATVIAARAHERIVRRAASNSEMLEVEIVDGKTSLETAKRRIDIIDIGPTAHTEHLLVAYLPDEGILFEADHFAMPRVGPVPPAVSSTKSFAKALAKQDIEVKKILSAHSPRVGTMGDLQQALETEVFQASR